MSKMVYLPYVRFEQEEGEAEGIGWYFTQYNAETGEGRGWHGTCLLYTSMQIGFLSRTPRGRCVTLQAYRHLNLEPADGQQML